MLATVVQEAVTDLGPHAAGLLVAHPNALRTALAVAADALREKVADKGTGMSKERAYSSNLWI